MTTEQPYAAVIGEALWDLLDRPEDRCYAQAPGGSCLNVAVGLARLGNPVEFVGAFGNDVLGERLREFLAAEGVAVTACTTVSAQSTLGVTTFAGAEPSFTFYGHPAAYAQLEPSPLIETVATSATVVHAGSIPLLSPTVYDTVLAAFAQTPGWKTLDPNVRPDLVSDLADYRKSLEQLAAHADVVKLSLLDAQAIYPEAPHEAPHRLLGAGAAAVIVTRGVDGARLLTATDELEYPSRATEVVDATGAGDATTVGVIHSLLRSGWPTERSEWEHMLATAMDVAGQTCARPGGAEAMPRHLRC